MKSKYFLILTIAFAVLGFTACDETDGTSVVPRFDRIDVVPARPAAGDSITATAHQAVIGHLINATTYTWQFSYSYNTVKESGYTVTKDTTVVLSKHVNYDGEDNSDPVIGYRLPANVVSGSRLAISIHATYNCSGQTASGALYGEATRSTQVNIDNAK